MILKSNYPQTVFGVIVSALKNEKKNVGPITGLSCDNLMQMEINLNKL